MSDRTPPPANRGSGQPTLRDVAALAGVHFATASRALSPGTRSLVNAKTLRRVVSAAEKLGYTPNPVARGLKTSRSLTVGVLVPDLTNPVFPPIVRGIEDVLFGADYTALLANTDNDPARERAQFEHLRARQVDGYILATAGRVHPLTEELVAKGVPVVLVNRTTDARIASCVTVDNDAGVRAAVDHLIELGHRKIAHLAGPQETSTGVARYRAFRNAIEERGLRPDDRLVVSCDFFTEAAGRAGFSELLSRGKGFSAVVAANDLIALGCLDVLAESPLTCPGDISIVGFNDMPFVDKVCPPLTSVRLPTYHMGAEAARLLIGHMSDAGGAAKSVLLPPELVVRASTAAPGDS